MRVAAMEEMITRRPAPGQPTPALGARSGSIVAAPPYAVLSRAYGSPQRFSPLDRITGGSRGFNRIFRSYEDAEALIHQYATTGVPVGDPGAHGEPVREPDHARLMR